MYGSNAQFDGNAAFSGGGFMPSQATQSANEPGFSPAKNRDAQSLLPLTVKQISDAFQASDDQAIFTIDGVDVNNVKLVGMMFEKKEKVTDVEFLLDDGTGSIVCHRWVNDALDFKEMELLSDAMYVKVHGHLKGFQGKIKLTVYSVRPITDYNEITHHFAECIYVHCYNTRVRKIQDAATQVTGQVPYSALNTPSKSYQATPSNQHSVQHNSNGVHQMILAYLHQPSVIKRVKGIHRDELAEQLNIPQHQLSAAIDHMAEEGLLYSTIDDDHIKTAANG